MCWVVLPSCSLVAGRVEGNGKAEVSRPAVFLCLSAPTSLYLLGEPSTVVRQSYRRPGRGLDLTGVFMITLRRLGSDEWIRCRPRRGAVHRRAGW
jgi:hypothetical protein